MNRAVKRYHSAGKAVGRGARAVRSRAKASSHNTPINRFRAKRTIRGAAMGAMGSMALVAVETAKGKRPGVRPKYWGARVVAGRRNPLHAGILVHPSVLTGVLVGGGLGLGSAGTVYRRRAHAHAARARRR